MTNLAMSNTAEGQAGWAILAVLNSGSKCGRAKRQTPESTPLPRRNSPCAVSLDRPLPQQDKGIVDRITLFSICALIFFLSACGSAPTRPPLLIAQLQTTEKSAHQAMQDGALILARNLFAQTLHLQQSLDDQAGAGVSMINLATLSHRLGDDPAALQYLESILTKDALYPAALRHTAAFRKAVILLDIKGVQDQEATAIAQAEQAISYAHKICAEDCAEAISLKNLQARFSLLQGDHPTALKIAESVSNDSSAAPEEQANAARIAAVAHSHLGNHDKALAQYLNALQLDKILGLSTRIILDLQGIVDTLHKLGRTQEAENYTHRAAQALAAEKALRATPQKN